ncbi:sigma-70 family RNA polymerase sigma factor [Mucilaginibacter sabulilitoris]|uniref:Sigma-70 family RNA polymerase sigma factor n=1 Tax=Mucilaginibacter sabulilitoris TaxID=1173583 RepID=A0ABZ0TPE3_9SPHI|nr:sigma-70 family RNA polymerase sigma factor [Mucilaginibacter sabulilitoris]WPU94767.1 sigma-70 family RNA polymerase sigma factor [Mucilaginibacter sabulilitoris]
MQNRISNEDIVGNQAGTLLEPHLWVERYADYLYKYAFGRLNDEQQARDLVQDTFLAALEKTGNFRGDSNERTWLTAILKYKVIDVYRKKSSVLVVTDQFGSAADEDEYFDPELNNWKREHWPQLFGVEENDPLHNKEFMGVLQQCLKRLPPLWMSVFRLKHLEDEITETICKEMKISSANFWVIIHRAKVNLRSCLQKNWI